MREGILISADSGPNGVGFSEHTPSKLCGKSEVPLMAFKDSKASIFLTKADCIPFNEGKFSGVIGIAPKELSKKLINHRADAFWK